MEKLLGMGETAKALGVSITTPRCREACGRISAEHAAGGHRRRDLAKIRHVARADKLERRQTVAHARVSSHDQKDDLERQEQGLERYCARQGWTFEVIADLGSGMNHRRSGLRRLLSAILSGDVGRLVIAHKDRLSRFGAKLVFAIREAKQVEVVILSQGEDTSLEEDLAKDALEIVTVFSARRHGARSRKNQRLLDNIKAVAEDTASC
ncbi:MAG: IS607 family transposase [Zoogloeaceae bacterium]|jgi:predicted site-specific integrase-resolvase|nr:IS607 family transposase [Zoogloeaceae bacterium]